MAVSKSTRANTIKSSASLEVELKKQQEKPAKKPAKKLSSLVSKSKETVPLKGTRQKSSEVKTESISKAPSQKKIFVLDTSVILYNHDCIKTFDDNDVALPITVLEELDNFKKGNDNINFEAREFIRIIDHMSENATLTDWIPLEKTKGGKFKVIMNERSMLDARLIFDDNKPDHRILNAALITIRRNILTEKLSLLVRTST
jgi:hypothetical protein